MSITLKLNNSHEGEVYPVSVTISEHEAVSFVSRSAVNVIESTPVSRHGKPGRRDCPGSERPPSEVSVIPRDVSMEVLVGDKLVTAQRVSGVSRFSVIGKCGGCNKSVVYSEELKTWMG